MNRCRWVRKTLFCSALVLSLSAAIPSAHAAAPAPASRGATVPWTTYEAETAKTNGAVLGPDFTGNTPAREASGRQCIQLRDAGAFVEFTAKSDAQGLVVRYSLADSPDGRGADATLSLLINGKTQPKLKLTSRYSHLYGEYPFSNKPADGKHRNFWDEARLMPPGAIHAGDVIRLQKSADDGAAEYLIDLIDLETVPAALQQPAGSLSVTDFGATATDDTDDRAAFVTAITAARQQKKALWLPAGRFVLKGAIDVADVSMVGAGMWYTTLEGVDDYASANRVSIQGTGSNVALADFAILGRLNYRNDEEPNDGIGGTFGTGSSIRNLWIEHTKTGGWIVNSDGLVVENCRFRNNIADGINLCIGMRNTVVRNCSTRGTGDDCFAMWPATYAKSTFTHGNNKFVNCTGQLPFLAQAFSIYGGDANAVENCVATDICYGAGLYASTTFPTEFGFRGTTTYHGVTLTRCGDGDGAIGTVANLLDLAGVHFEDIDVIDSPKDAIRFTSMKEHALRDATFDRIKIVNVGLSGSGHAISEPTGATGTAKLSNVSVQTKNASWQDDSPAFKLVLGTGNAGIEEPNKQSNAGQ